MTVNDTPPLYAQSPAGAGPVATDTQTASAAPAGYAIAPSLREVAGGDALRLKDFGPAVEWLQRALNARGAALEPDGKLGPATVRAVRAFQAANGCEVDGVVGQETLNALRGTPTATSTSESADQRQVRQQRDQLTGAQVPTGPTAPMPPAAGATVSATAPRSREVPGLAALPETPAAVETPAATASTAAPGAGQPSAEQIIATGEQYLGRVDYSQRVDGEPQGWQYLGQVFEEISGWRPSDAELRRTHKPGNKSWCGVWAAWVYKQAGVEGVSWNLNRGRMEGVDRIYAGGAQYPTQKAFREGIRPGDVVVFKQPGVPMEKQLWHHAIVVSVDGDTLTTLDGNTSYGRIVRRTTHPVANVAAIMRPQEPPAQPE